MIILEWIESNQILFLEFLLYLLKLYLFVYFSYLLVFIGLDLFLFYSIHVL